jgi:hypothetical protein
MEEYASGRKPWSRTYFVTVKLKAQRRIVASSIRSTVASPSRRTRRTLPTRVPPMPEPTIDDVDALVGPATPHFAYQLRARVHELVMELPEDHPVRRYAAGKMELLERLAHASSKAEEGGREPRTRPGWEELPSSAPADAPLPPRG